MKGTMSISTRGQTVMLAMWDTGSVPGLILAMVMSAALSMFLQFIHNFVDRREWTQMIYKRTKHRNENSRSYCSKSKTSRILTTFFHFLRETIHYCLMLCVMTHNIWIFTSLLIGSGIGYYLVRANAFHHTRPCPEQEVDEPLQSPRQHDADGHVRDADGHEEEKDEETVCLQKMK